MAYQIKRQSDSAFFKPKRELGKRDARGWPIGPRTERRQKENRELNKLPDSVKNFCELRLPGCLKSKFLSWAHSQKSRFLVTGRDWQEAARSCAACHQTIEALPHSKMHAIVVTAIRRRKSNEANNPQTANSNYLGASSDQS